MYYVYGLIDPINKLPFYIGKGKGKRMYDHLKGLDTTNHRKCNSINTLRFLGHEPEIYIFMDNILDENDAYDIEYSLIKRFCNNGVKLTNRIGVDLRPPCRKGAIMSLEAKKKISDFNKGRKRRALTTDERMKLSLSQKGQKKSKRTDEHKRKIGESKAKRYTVILPDQTEIEVFNLRKFCQENGLSYSKMQSTLAGRQSNHKNFRVKSKISNPINN